MFNVIHPPSGEKEAALSSRFRDGLSHAVRIGVDKYGFLFRAGTYSVNIFPLSLGPGGYQGLDKFSDINRFISLFFKMNVQAYPVL